MITLNALPRHWEPFLQSTSGRGDLLEFDRLWTDYTQEETRLIARGVQESHHDDNQALASHVKRGKINRRSFNKAFKDKKTSTASGHEHRKDISKIQCFRCDKYGHIARDFPTSKKGRQHASTTDVDSEPHQRDEEIKDEAFLCISTLLGTIPIDSDIWLIDSGASKHMIGYRDHLTDLVEKEFRLHVVLGDNARYTVKRVGSSTFQLDSDIPLQLSEVLYVLGMKRNLVSISSLEDNGYKVTFSEGKFLAWHKNSHMDSARMIGVRENNLYRLIVRPVQALLHDIISLSELWHRRLAHLYYRSLPILGKMVTGLLEIHIEHEGICRGCALGKNVKGSFSSSDNRSKGFLDLIHTDVCGPMNVASLSGYLYYVLFIDDHSRKTWIYFLKTKDGVLVRFQEFKSQIENLTGRKIKVLISDNGGEYTSRDFNDFCIEVGIKREYVVPYKPQQNGVVERKNISIVEATKAMIHDQNLPMILLAEASMRTVYMQNMIPHKIMKNMTLEEAFTGVNPEVGHFMIFMCPIYIHVPKEKRTKLDPLGRKGTFVGYNESSKEYQIYIPGQRQIKSSRDVTFEEEITFQRSIESQMEIDSGKVPSPPSTVQRETITDPVDPVDTKRGVNQYQVQFKNFFNLYLNHSTISNEK
jgi:hypothetical protein